LSWPALARSDGAVTGQAACEVWPARATKISAPSARRTMDRIMFLSPAAQCGAAQECTRARALATEPAAFGVQSSCCWAAMRRLADRASLRDSQLHADQAT